MRKGMSKARSLSPDDRCLSVVGTWPSRPVVALPLPETGIDNRGDDGFC